jgi:hypothetical protein
MPIRKGITGVEPTGSVLQQLKDGDPQPDIFGIFGEANQR